MGMDVIVPTLTRFMSVYTAGRLFLLFSFVLVLLGGIWLHRALFGRLSAWPLLAALFLFGYVLHLGFVNYLFGISLVVPAFALWVQSERWDWRARLAASAVAALAVYFCHYFAFIAYGLCVAGYEAGRVWSIRPFSWRATLLRAAAAGAQAVMPMALQAGAAGNGLGAVTSYGTLAERILGLLSPAMFPGSRADLAIMALAALGLVLGLVTHRVALAPAMRGPLLLLALAAVAIPAIVSATWGMQFRLPMLFTWLLAASIEVRVSGWRVVSVVAAAMLLFVSHIATIALSWRARGAQ